MVGVYIGKPIPQKPGMEPIRSYNGVVLYKREHNNKVPYAIFKGTTLINITEYRLAMKAFHEAVASI